MCVSCGLHETPGIVALRKVLARCENWPFKENPANGDVHIQARERLFKYDQYAFLIRPDGCWRSLTLSRFENVESEHAADQVWQFYYLFAHRPGFFGDKPSRLAAILTNLDLSPNELYDAAHEFDRVVAANREHGLQRLRQDAEQLGYQLVAR